MPRFSIIVPVYNVAPYLRECLDSILAQSFADWETICVDDGSTDGSSAILDEYSSRDTRIRAMHQANAGVSSARNAALDVAAGEWIWFVDGDDAIHPDALEYVTSALNLYSEAEGFMYPGFISLPEKPLCWDKLPDVSLVEFTDRRNGRSYGMARHTGCTTIYRRSRLQGLRLSETCKMAEDTLFAVTYWWQTCKWVMSTAKLYFYRQRRNSAALPDNVDKKAVRDWLEVECKLADMLREHHDEICVDKDMHEFYCRNGYMAWCTFRNFYFRLPMADRKELFGLWLELQKKNFLISDHVSPYRRFVVGLMERVPVFRPFLKMFVQVSRAANMFRLVFVRLRGV